MSITVALVQAMSLLVSDAKGHHPTRPMPADEAKAIVTTCSFTQEPTHCAALLVVLSFRESGHNREAKHDGGKGCGAFGALCTYPHATIDDQVVTAWKLVVKSASVCKEALTMYCSGSCERGQKIAREYLEMAKQIAAQATEPR